jgi:hypothetical protein
VLLDDSNEELQTSSIDSPEIFVLFCFDNPLTCVTEINAGKRARLSCWDCFVRRKGRSVNLVNGSHAGRR